MPPEDAEHQRLTAVAPGDRIPDPAQPVPGSEAEPEPLEFDFEQRRVRFPGLGWISAEDFWAIYLNQPEKLPADLDHMMLEQFRHATRAP